MKTAIDVVLVTWPNHPKRWEYFRRTHAALMKHLTASRHHMNWYCSAESERDERHEWFGYQLSVYCRDHRIHLCWRNAPASLGGAMNDAIRMCLSPVNFLVQDDFELLHPLDLSPGSEFMLSHPSVDLLRYSYFLHPEHGTQFQGEIDGWRRVKIDGPWPYGDDPALRPLGWLDRVGSYIEGGRHGASEGDMVYRLAKRKATICAADKCYFGHFGEVASVPESKEYRERAIRR